MSDLQNHRRIYGDRSLPIISSVNIFTCRRRKRRDQFAVLLSNSHHLTILLSKVDHFLIILSNSHHCQYSSLTHIVCFNFFLTTSFDYCLDYLVRFVNLCLSHNLSQNIPNPQHMQTYFLAHIVCKPSYLTPIICQPSYLSNIIYQPS